ncbi:CPBP family intramembrane glutamic endopeptidase [[Limnothrix rosea] IAM M-220]|uniref:CPBP family intramembrane glutamic endopeptidase n=1 Tax=[Limnothrix rosea] IAM M-220 TaxID=454133 RepID=UPI0009617145|nr:type II CAAX endopeptidase family protein [[Limnothrix rosea] IAM M-220]OKH19370.1 abortive phage infection protein [[Limnothrix rosea] IAM M-220]
MKPFWQLCRQSPAPLRLFLFFASLAVLWLPLATPLYLLLRQDENLTTIVTMGLLFVIFLFYLPRWVKQVHSLDKPFGQYGLVWQKINGVELLQGLAWGFCFTWGLLIIQHLLGLLTILPPSTTIIRFALEGALTGLGVALAEELVFRGWIYDELERDYHPTTVLWSCGGLFGIAHFLKPLMEMIRTLPVLPGLTLLGMTLVWAKRGCRGRLGKPIGLHGGLVWGYYIFNVGGLIQYHDDISPWITGVDGNPLGGLCGIIGLSCLAWLMWRSQRHTATP